MRIYLRYRVIFPSCQTQIFKKPLGKKNPRPFLLEIIKELLAKQKEEPVVSGFLRFIFKCDWHAIAVPCKLTGFHQAAHICQCKDLFWKVFCFQGIQLLRKQFTLGSKISAQNGILHLAHMHIKLNKWFLILLTKFPKKTYSTTATTTVHLLRLWVKNACVCACLEYQYKGSNDKWFPAKFFCSLSPLPQIKIILGKIFCKSQWLNWSHAQEEDVEISSTSNLILYLKDKKLPSAVVWTLASVSLALIFTPPPLTLALRSMQLAH